MIMETKDALKSMGRAIVGLAVLAAFVMAAIGTVSILICGHYFQFAVATIVCLVFAVNPMWKIVQKFLM